MRDRDIRTCLLNHQVVALYPVMRPVVSMGPSDFRPSRILKKNLDGRRFASDVYVKQAVICCPQTLGFNLLYSWTQTLVPQWYQCLNVYGDRMEVRSATHMPCTDQNENRVLGIRLFLASFEISLCMSHSTQVL